MKHFYKYITSLGLALFTVFNLGWAPRHELRTKKVVMHYKNIEYDYTGEVTYNNVFLDFHGNVYITHTHKHHLSMNEGDTCTLVYRKMNNTIVNIFPRDFD